MTAIEHEHVVCNLCGTDDPQLLYTIDLGRRQLNRVWVEDRVHHVHEPARIVRCRRCGLMYVTPRLVDAPGFHPYSRAMEQAYFEQTRPARRRAFATLVRRLSEWLDAPPNSLIDVGCGDGVLLQEARKVGIQSRGTELSPELAQYARDQLGQDTILPADLSALPSNSYDVATLINVIEHVRDPAGMLVQIGRILRPGGIVLIHTPNAGGLPALVQGERWSQIEPLGHFYYFDRATLSRMMGRAGLQPIGQFGLVVAPGVKGQVQRLLHGLGVFIDNGLGLVGRRG